MPTTTRLSGSVVNDAITGYGTNDRIDGNYGNATLNGGAGADAAGTTIDRAHMLTA